MPRNVIVAAFQDPEDALSALHELRVEHFSPRRLGIIAQGPEGGMLHRSLAELAGRQASPGGTIGHVGETTAGAAYALRVAAGLLPSLGPVVVGGRLLASAQAATGGFDGTLVDALVGMGVPDPDAAYYDRQLEDGQTVVTVSVRTGSESAIALDIITSHGGYQRRLAA